MFEGATAITLTKKRTKTHLRQLFRSLGGNSGEASPESSVSSVVFQLRNNLIDVCSSQSRTTLEFSLGSLEKRFLGPSSQPPQRRMCQTSFCPQTSVRCCGRWSNFMHDSEGPSIRPATQGSHRTELDCHVGPTATPLRRVILPITYSFIGIPIAEPPMTT